jgi:hypothetical protein
MSEKDYYPAGAYNDPNAPYNEVEYPEHDFDMVVSVTLTHDVTITTNQYNAYVDDEDGHTEYETDNIDWKDEYENQYWSLPELLDKMRGLLDKWKPEKMKRADKHLYERIMDESQGWEQEEMEVIEHE